MVMMTMIAMTAVVNAAAEHLHEAWPSRAANCLSSASRDVDFLSAIATHTHTHNHFTALCTLSGLAGTRRYVHFAIFWIFWCKMKITQADTPTVQMDYHPSRLIGAPIFAIPTIFTQDTLPGTTLPIYPGLGQALHMLACIPGGLVPPFLQRSVYNIHISPTDLTQRECVFRKYQKSVHISCLRATDKQYSLTRAI